MVDSKATRGLPKYKNHNRFVEKSNLALARASDHRRGDELRDLLEETHPRQLKRRIHERLHQLQRLAERDERS